MSPTRRAAAAVGLIAVAAVAVPIDPLVWFLVLFGLIGAAVADALTLRHPPAIRREIRTSLVRGVPAVLRVVLVPRPVDGADDPRRERASVLSRTAVARTRVRQPVPPEIRVEPSEQDAGLEADLLPSVRGHHVLPPVVIRCTGPLGLMRRDFKRGDPLGLDVYPDLPGARRMAAARREQRRREGRSRGPLGLGTEFESVREYVPDDDVRRINWKATARLGRPMTNQYRVEQDRDILCMVDCGRLMSSPVGSATRLDLSLDALAAVAVAAEESGDRPGGIAFAGSLLRSVAARRGGAERLVRGFADLEAVGVDSDYEMAFRLAADRKRALVVVFTDLLDDSASRHLADSVPVLARRHAVLVASVTDPDITAIMTTPPGRILDVVTMSVALDVISSRERVIGRLRSQGVYVVDAAAESFADACVDGYLALKRRARVDGPGAAAEQHHGSPEQGGHAEPEHERRADSDAHRCHEPFDQAGDDEQERCTDQHLGQPRGDRRQGVGTRHPPGIDQSSCKPEADAAGDHDAGQLQTAMRSDQLDGVARLPRPDGEPHHHAEQHPVERQRQRREDPTRHPTGEGEDGDADVVGEDLRRGEGALSERHAEVCTMGP